MNLLPKQKRILASALLLFCMAIVARHAFTGANQRTPQGQPLHWKLNTPIPYVVNPRGVPGFSGELELLVVLGAVNDAFRPWTEIPDAAVTFAPGGSSNVTLGCPDGLNLVTFQDDQTVSFPPGVLAFAGVTFAAGAGLINSGTSAACPQAHQYNAEFAGQILEVDITFNPNPGSLPFSPVGANNTIDLVAVATHEAGHLLGLDHTGVFSSIMNPYSENVDPNNPGGATANRTLFPDESGMIASLYPALTFAPSRGSITGTITTSAGAPVKSAHVVAFGATTGAPAGSQLTGADGRYSIDWLPPGTYRVLAEPLDGPIDLSNFGSFYREGGSNNFSTTFLGSVNAPTSVSVTAGQSATANIAVTDPSSGTLNIESLVLLTEPAPGQFAFGPPDFQLYLPRGKSYQVGVIGSNLGSSELSFTSPANPAPTEGGNLTDGRNFRYADLSISPSAALGPTNLYLKNSSTSVMPGGIITTVNPGIATPLRNSGGFGTTFAPGTLISIFGTDLARGRGPDGIEFWLGPPAPTSMGGVSVKIGGRYAPVFFVSPGQINALIPYETPVGSASVTVITGPNAAGNTVNITIDPTAPGIFTVGGDREDRGAILNGADNPQTVAAPTGVFPGSHPARPGDIVVIYASGLGPVTPSLPSGIGAGANGTANPLLNRHPTVRIGGQTADIVYDGLAPGFVGLYQLNVRVPSGVAAGSAVPVVVTTAEGQTSNTATMAVSD